MFLIELEVVLISFLTSCGRFAQVFKSVESIHFMGFCLCVICEFFRRFFIRACHNFKIKL